jgi:drug/metabolite transporter (DMT)-like permease
MNHGGLGLCALGALSFGLLAIVSKAAERARCRTSALVMWLFGWATLALVVRSSVPSLALHIPWKIIVLAIVLGLCAAVSYLAFQTSIAMGKTTVGWLMMNLSAGVPALVSVWLYHEQLTNRKIIGLSLTALSLLCLFEGNRRESASLRRKECS